MGSRLEAKGSATAAKPDDLMLKIDERKDRLESMIIQPCSAV